MDGAGVVVATDSHASVTAVACPRCLHAGLPCAHELAVNDLNFCLDDIPTLYHKSYARSEEPALHGPQLTQRGIALSANLAAPTHHRHHPLHPGAKGNVGLSSQQDDDGGPTGEPCDGEDFHHDDSADSTTVATTASTQPPPACMDLATQALADTAAPIWLLPYFHHTLQQAMQQLSRVAAAATSDDAFCETRALMLSITSRVQASPTWAAEWRDRMTTFCPRQPPAPLGTSRECLLPVLDMTIAHAFVEGKLGELQEFATSFNMRVSSASLPAVNRRERHSQHVMPGRGGSNGS